LLPIVQLVDPAIAQARAGLYGEKPVPSGIQAGHDTVAAGVEAICVHNHRHIELGALRICGIREDQR
jgi:hypothetical protein